MKRDRDERAEPSSLPLFDLPLQTDDEVADVPRSPAPITDTRPEADDRSDGTVAAPERKPDAAGDADRSPAVADAPAASALFAGEEVALGVADELGHQADRDDAAVTVRARAAAGVADLVAILLAVALAALAARALGVAVTARSWPTFAFLALPFSFLYTVIPLAFWGQTPGMAWSGLEARAVDDQPLTFGQTSLRWLAAVLTVLLAGVPLIVALTGASLGDRLSGSATAVAK